MPKVFLLKPPENQHNRSQSPTTADNDRYTPMPTENFHEKKPEVYYIGGKNDDEPRRDEQPYKSSSSPINNFRSTSPHNGPELYHLKTGDNENDIPDHRRSPALINNNRTSPISHENSNGQGPEMYYIKTDKDVRNQSPHFNDNNQKTKFNDNNHLTPSDNPDQQKATMYMLTTPDGENQPPLSRLQRTPSPPIRPAKKHQPVSYEIFDDNNKYDISNKQRPFPTALHDVPTNFRYRPLSQSKASESIQRSMNKYRFGSS